MKTICLRLLTLLALAAGLNFISEAGIKIEEGKVFIVGRCLIEEPVASKVDDKARALRVGIAQAEFEIGASGEPVFKIKKIYSVNTDANGYFMVKNVAAGFSYIFLGIQLSSDQPLSVSELKLVNAAEKQSRVLSLGTHILTFGDSLNHSVRSGKDISIAEYMKNFSAKDRLTKFVHHVCNRSGYWGNGNCLTNADAGKVVFTGLKTAEWVKVGAES